MLRSALLAGDATLADVEGGRLRLGAPGTAPYPAPVLSSGPAIAKIQVALIMLSHLARGGDDGKFGRNTGDAVVKFKDSRRIRPNDPVMGPLTIAALDDAMARLEHPDPGPGPRPKPEPKPHPKPAPHPKPSPNHRNWFTADQRTGLSRVLPDSQVSFLVDAENYYADLRTEIDNATARRQGGMVCWVGFEVRDNTAMPRTPNNPQLRPFPRREWAADDLTWGKLLELAAYSGMSVRALLNLHPSPKDPTGYLDMNLRTVAVLNRMPNTLAINDFRYLLMNGTHHQKLVIVQTPEDVVAYIGTADIHPTRINERWCEIQCKVRGEAARELYRIFFDRWQEHTAVLADQPHERAWIPRPEEVPVSPAAGQATTQISSTYGNPQRPNPFAVITPKVQAVNLPHRVVIGLGDGSPGPLPAGYIVANDFFKEKDPAAKPLIAMARRQAQGYAFAPSGRTGIYHQIKAALDQGPQYIYVEDQYLIDDEPMGSLVSMLELLKRRVQAPDFKKLIVFCTRIAEINDEMQGLAVTHRHRFVSDLTAAGGSKVVVCQYKSHKALGTVDLDPKNPDKSPFYIHSKSWIFDDELAIIGSANCNRRGYSHDSELDIGVIEAAAVRDLRIRVWLRRLNTQAVRTPLTSADIADFASAAKYWERPEEFGLTIENHRIGLDKLLARPAVRWTMPAAWQPALAAIAPIAGLSYERLFWELVVDPEGTCQRCTTAKPIHELAEPLAVGSPM